MMLVTEKQKMNISRIGSIGKERLKTSYILDSQEQLDHDGS